MSEDLTARQVADRLGVELSTVYAYASRGSLTRRPGPDGRSSTVRRRRGRAPRPPRPPPLHPSPGWARSTSSSARPSARSATAGSATATTTSSTWPLGARSRRRASCCGPASCPGPPRRPARCRGPGRRCPPRSSGTRRPYRGARSAPASSSERRRRRPGSRGPPPPSPSVRTPRSVVDALVAALPLVGDPAPLDVAGRRPACGRVSPAAPHPARLRALDTALVLLAEHELATSTLAVRVAASPGPSRPKRSSPGWARRAARSTAAAVACAPAPGRGPRPGGHDALAGLRPPGPRGGRPPLRSPAGGRARHRQPPPPRGDRALRRAPGRRRPAQRRRRPGRPRLRGRGRARASPRRCSAIARTAGWLAHAFEEADEVPVRFRGRTLYRGPADR